MVSLALRNRRLTPSNGCYFALIESRFRSLSAGVECPHSEAAKAFICRNVGVPNALASSLRSIANGPNIS